jgi:glucose-6-phosphate 1-epimerase
MSATAAQSVGGVTAISFHGLPALELIGPQGARAIVTLHGAQVLSWVPADSNEQLYLSEQSDFSGKGPIRGGVPVCFPQFSGQGPLPKHGLVRTVTWQLLEQHCSDLTTSVTLSTEDSAETRALWPHQFRVRLNVALGASTLEIMLSVANTGAQPFTFTTALHTYLRVADINTVHVDGLRGIAYRDAANGNRLATQDAARLGFTGETDRVYHAAPALQVGDNIGPMVSILARHFVDTVVWNPGPDLCARLPDMPDTGYRNMLCVEAACADTSITLARGQSWEGSQRLQALNT